MMVSNPLRRRRTFALKVETLAGGSRWTVVTEPPAVTLRPGEQSAVLVSVTAPLDAVLGSTADWEVKLLNKGRAGRSREGRRRVPKPIASNRVGAEVTEKRRAIVEFTMNRWNTGQVTLAEAITQLRIDI